MVSFVLIIIVIKFVLFPLLSLVTGTSLPIVIIESCSMYHEQVLDDWWGINGDLYSLYGVSKEDFKSYRFVNGLNKGDIIFLVGGKKYNKGDVIVFNAHPTASRYYPIIHRVVGTDPIETKGDNNNLQLVANPEFSNNRAGVDEINISISRIQGVAVGRIPYLGWVKLIFFDFMKPADERGFCRGSTQPKL